MGFHIKAQGNSRQVIEDSVVMDAAGIIYPAATWKELLMKGYAIKPFDPSHPGREWLLYRKVESSPFTVKVVSGKPRESAYFKKGKTIIPFETTDINGNRIDIKEMRGKIIVMNFWFMNCGPCRKEIPDLNALVDSFKTNDRVMFLAVGLDDKASIMEFLKKFPFEYTIIDNGRRLAGLYNIRSFPTHVVIDPEGKVYFHTSGLGASTIYWIRQSIQDILAREPTTPAIH